MPALSVHLFEKVAFTLLLGQLIQGNTFPRHMKDILIAFKSGLTSLHPDARETLHETKYTLTLNN